MIHSIKFKAGDRIRPIKDKPLFLRTQVGTVVDARPGPIGNLVWIQVDDQPVPIIGIFSNDLEYAQ